MVRLTRSSQDPTKRLFALARPTGVQRSNFVPLSPDPPEGKHRRIQEGERRRGPLRQPQNPAVLTDIMTPARTRFVTRALPYLALFSPELSCRGRGLAAPPQAGRMRAPVYARDKQSKSGPRLGKRRGQTLAGTEGTTKVKNTA